MTLNDLKTATVIRTRMKYFNDFNDFKRLLMTFNDLKTATVIRTRMTYFNDFNDF